MNESADAFKPTCFMNVNDLNPEAAAVAATSIATFSLVENSKYILASLANTDKIFPISDDGVPGYVAAIETPASITPLTAASLPNKNCLSPETPVTNSFRFIIFSSNYNLYNIKYVQ